MRPSAREKRFTAFYFRAETATLPQGGLTVEFFEGIRYPNNRPVFKIVTECLSARENDDTTVCFLKIQFKDKRPANTAKLHIQSAGVNVLDIVGTDARKKVPGAECQAMHAVLLAGENFLVNHFVNANYVRRDFYGREHRGASPTMSYVRSSRSQSPDPPPTIPIHNEEQDQRNLQLRWGEENDAVVLAVDQDNNAGAVQDNNAEAVVQDNNAGAVVQDNGDAQIATRVDRLEDEFNGLDRTDPAAFKQRINRIIVELTGILIRLRRNMPAVDPLSESVRNILARVRDLLARQ